MKEKTRLSLVIKTELHDQLKEMAEKNGVSMNYFASNILANHINTYKTIFEKLTSNESILEMTKLMLEMEKKDKE